MCRILTRWPSRSRKDTATQRLKKRESWKMAALNIAFEAPDNARAMGPSRERPIDLVHLAKQTMGDKVLEIEVLQMFARQARNCLQEIGSGNGDTATAAAPQGRGKCRRRIQGRRGCRGLRRSFERCSPHGGRRLARRRSGKFHSQALPLTARRLRRRSTLPGFGPRRGDVLHCTALGRCNVDCSLELLEEKFRAFPPLTFTGILL